jgi:hypothetical protein
VYLNINRLFHDVGGSEYRAIDINESETVPLIGMRLLRGYDLKIRTIEGGVVTIEQTT